MQNRHNIKILLIGLLLGLGACAPTPAVSSTPNAQATVSTPVPATALPDTTVAPAVPETAQAPVTTTPLNAPAPAEPAPAVPTTSPPPAPPPAVTATGPAAFTLSNLSIYPKQPAPRGYVMVSVDVTNTGGVEGTYALDVKVDGVTVVTENVTLAGGASQTVKTGFAAGKMGTYTLSVGDLSMEMVVFMQM